MSKTDETINEQDALMEINTAIRDGLNQWADVMLESEAKQWAYKLNYFPRDIVNACLIFQHICSNVGIKKGLIDEQKAEVYGKRFRQLVIDMTGYDPAVIVANMNPEEGTTD
jgi:hypothetical protein